MKRQYDIEFIPATQGTGIDAAKLVAEQGYPVELDER